MTRLPIGGPSFFTEKCPLIINRPPIYLSNLIDVLQAHRSLTELFLSGSGPSPTLSEPIALMYVRPSERGGDGQIIAVLKADDVILLPIYDSFVIDPSRIEHIQDLNDFKALKASEAETTRLYAAVHRSGSRFWRFDVLKIGPLTVTSDFQSKPLYHVFPKVLHWEISVQ